MWYSFFFSFFNQNHNNNKKNKNYYCNFIERSRVHVDLKKIRINYHEMLLIPIPNIEYGE